MSKILEHKSSCTKSDPYSCVQLFHPVSSDTDVKSCLLSFALNLPCPDFFCFIVLDQKIQWAVVSSSPPPCHWWFYRSLRYSSPFMFFSTWKAYRLLCHSLYHSFFLFWYYLFSRGRYQPSIQCSKCRRIMDLHDRVMSVSQLCSLLSILLPFPSYF